MGVFLLVDLEDRLGDPRSARPGSTSPRSPEPLSPSRPLRGYDPFRLVLNRRPQEATKAASDLSAPRSARDKATRFAGGQVPALTRAAGRADTILSAPGEMSLLSHQEK
jgi:hypothetical protein